MNPFKLTYKKYYNIIKTYPHRVHINYILEVIFMKSILNYWKKYSYIILIAFIIIGLFDFRIGLIATLCMFAPIVVSFFKGRFWCGNLCPRGGSTATLDCSVAPSHSPAQFILDPSCHPVALIPGQAPGRGSSQPGGLSGRSDTIDHSPGPAHRPGGRPAGP